MPVGFHAIARLLGNQGRCDDPTAVTLFRQIAKEPIAGGAGLIDKYQELAFREEPWDQFVELVLSGSNGAEVDDLGMGFLSNVGHGC
jgi:hypothetical protein